MCYGFRGMPTPPLAGTLVVAVEQAVAVPFATRQLADLGARVIKIERPNGGDFARVNWNDGPIPSFEEGGAAPVKQSHAT